MTAYYNEIDPYKAEWLRNLIAAGLIAPGHVDETDIRDIAPDDLAGFTQCHFFAGIGVWSHALRLAGWPDDAPVWTASCPCQPFSAAGRRAGAADERHLWPHLHWLIARCRPRIVFGEQVASRDGLAWFDIVHADLEAEAYACGAVDLCAAGLGAPHIRQRLFWMAYADSPGERGRYREEGRAAGEEQSQVAGHNGERLRFLAGGSCDAIQPLAHPDSGECQRIADSEGCQPNGPARGWQQSHGLAERGGAIDAGPMGHPGGAGLEIIGQQHARSECAAAERAGEVDQLADALPAGWPERWPEPGHGPLAWRGATRGFWAAAEWLACSDGKARPVEPGTFPLAHGVAGRVAVLRPAQQSEAASQGQPPEEAHWYSRIGALHGYGDAIVAPVAAAFIAAAREVIP